MKDWRRKSGVFQRSHDCYAQKTSLDRRKPKYTGTVKPIFAYGLKAVSLIHTGERHYWLSRDGPYVRFLGLVKEAITGDLSIRMNHELEQLYGKTNFTASIQAIRLSWMGN